MSVENSNSVQYQSRDKSKPVLPSVFFIKIRTIKYRVVRDNYSGFKCQKWRIWFPFWCQTGVVPNTHSSIEKAIEYIENDMNIVAVAH